MTLPCYDLVRRVFLVIHLITNPIDNQLTEERVDLSVFSPACLPGIGKNFVDQNGHVYGEQRQPMKTLVLFYLLSISGWGDTGVQETSTDKLQETVVPIVESSNCIERVNQTRGVNKDLIVCAGGASEGPCKVFKGNQNMIGITLKPRATVVGHLQ